MKVRQIFLPILILLMATTAYAAPTSWKIDTAHSGIYFDAKHIFATIRGHFDDYTATLTIDPDDITQSSCQWTVQAKSITTFNRKRDTHLRSEEFFDTGDYPTLTFQSTKIMATGGNRYTIEGDLTIRGITKKISAPLIFHGITPNPFKKREQVSGFTTQFTINRLDFKVGNGKFYTMGVMDKEVDVTISLEALK